MDERRSFPVHALAIAGALLFAASLAVGGFAYVVRFDAVAPEGTPLAPGLLYNVLLFSVFAMHHSVLARTGLKRVLHAWIGPALERIFYVIVASALFLLCCVAWVPLPGVWYVLPWPGPWVGMAMQLAGVVVTVIAARAMDLGALAGLRTARQSADEGADRPLETGGLYGWVRHPMYFGWLLLVAGAPAMTATRGWFAVLSVGYLVLAIPFEERSLVGVFGEPYRQYQRSVPWRMLPGIY